MKTKDWKGSSENNSDIGYEFDYEIIEVKPTNDKKDEENETEVSEDSKD